MVLSIGSYSSTLGAGGKPHLHTPKAVTYHEQSPVINHDRSQPWAYGIQNKQVYATMHLHAERDFGENKHGQQAYRYKTNMVNKHAGTEV